MISPLHIAEQAVPAPQVAVAPRVVSRWLAAPVLVVAGLVWWVIFLAVASWDFARALWDTAILGKGAAEQMEDKL